MSTRSLQTTVAGLVRPSCECCPEPALLLNHVQLGGTRLFCPTTRRTYLDRGDGVFQSDGQVIDSRLATTGTAPTANPASNVVDARAEVLSDRPARTTDKVRISLESATFA
jgi:hypothetical protein